MRIAEYKKIDTRTEQRVITHEAEYDEDGNIIAEAYDETISVDVPIMGMVYRDATPEEEAESERMATEMPTEPIDETAQRIAELEDALIELASMLEEING